MKAIQRAMVMTLVATALCADRSLATPQAVRPDLTPAASRTLAGRLTVSLRRTVPGIRLVEMRRDQERPWVPVVRQLPALRVVPVSLSPFQFRLPPPSV